MAKAKAESVDAEPLHKSKASHPLDVQLGARVRLFRKEKGMSQDQLAVATGITFQQIQKYEHGTNRISFSRLCEIAEALETSVIEVIGDLGPQLRRGKQPEGISDLMSSLKQPEIVDLVKTVTRIKSKKQRRNVLAIARQLVDQEAA